MDPKNLKKLDRNKFEVEMRNIILYSFIWGFGGMLQTEDRAKYNKFLQEVVKGKVDVNAEYKL